MLATETYQLAYDGAGKHEILGLSKASMASSYSKQLAEYFLQKLDYAGNARSAASYALRNQTVTATADPAANYVRHIHRDCKKEIESKWTKPMLTDGEVNEILFQDKLAKELEKIIPRVEVNLECG